MSRLSHKTLRRPRQSKPTARPACKAAARTTSRDDCLGIAPVAQLSSQESVSTNRAAHVRHAKNGAESGPARFARPPLNKTARRHTRWMNKQFECDGASTSREGCLGKSCAFNAVDTCELQKSL